MAPLSARRLADMISLCARVAAIEFVVAAQAIDLRALSVSGLGVSGLGVSGLGVSGLGVNGLGELGTGTGRAYRMIRELVPFTQADGTFPADLEPVVDLVTRGDLTPAA
jgi:histidine ammonia-lyase